MKKKIGSLAFVVLLLLGIGMLAYPTVSAHVNQVNGSTAVQQLADELAQQEDEALQLQRSLAQWYNLNLISGQPEEGFEKSYDDILCYANRMMGSIEIPGIGVNLPIYHGVSEEVLSKGIGHMPSSAFPIGGEGNHAALVGHTGLPSGKFFDDLTDLEAGDLFYIHILDETLAYRVEEVLVVEPEDAEDLDAVPGKDLCTLITCTPYGVNSHRLLVQGARTELPSQEVMAPAEDPGVPSETPWPYALAGLGAAAGIALLILLIRKRKRT